MGLTLVTPAAASPVTLAEAKAWCRVNGTASDGMVTTMLEAAVTLVEEYLGKALGSSQTWRLSLDAFTDTIELVRGPVTAVTAVTYTDLDGVEQTVDTDIYTLDLVSDPAWVVLNSGESWPEPMDVVNAVQIEFVAGYPSLPAPIKTGLLSLVAQWYDNRTPGAMSDGIKQMLSPYRRIVI